MPDKTVETTFTFKKRDYSASFKSNKDLWLSFKDTCTARGLSVCHVLEALMVSFVEGQKALSTVVQPIQQHFTIQHIVERPRRIYRRKGSYREYDDWHTNSTTITDMDEWRRQQNKFKRSQRRC